MNTIKNFSIFKIERKEPNEKFPTHTLSAKIGDDYVEVGSAWTKESKNGKYLSCKLSNAWINEKDNTKSKRSYVLIAEEDLDELATLLQHSREKSLTGLKGEKVDINPFSEDVY